MKLVKSRPGKQLVVRLTAAASVTVVLLAACSDEPSPRTEPTSSLTAAPTETLFVEGSDTDRLQICVDVSPWAAAALSTGGASDLVTSGFLEYGRLYRLASAAEKAAGGPNSPPLLRPAVTPGCPDGYLPPSEAGFVKPDCVDIAPRFQVRVFVGTPSELGGFIRTGEHYVRRPFERGMCSGHTSAEVSTALYIPTDEARDARIMGWGLADVTGSTPILRYPCGHPDTAKECQGIRP